MASRHMMSNVLWRGLGRVQCSRVGLARAPRHLSSQQALDYHNAYTFAIVARRGGQGLSPGESLLEGPGLQRTEDAPQGLL